MRRDRRNPRPAARERIAVKVLSNRELVAQAIRDGKSPTEIAAMLNLNTAFASRIQTAAVIALPTLPKAPSTRDWSDKDDTELLDLRNKRGQTWIALMQHTGRGKNELQLRYGYLQLLEAKRLRQGANVEMDCMTCKRPFISENKITNRRCDPCKNDTDGLPEGFMCFGGSITERASHAE